MENGHHHDTIFLSPIINTEWKPLRNDTSDFLTNDSKLKRLLRSPRYTTINLGDELPSKTGAPALIPCTRVDEFSACRV